MPRRARGPTKAMRQVQFLVVLLIVVVLAASFLFSPETAQSVVELFIKYVFIPGFISVLVGMIVESAGGNSLKKMAWNIRVGPLRFSITAFWLAVLVLKFILF